MNNKEFYELLRKCNIITPIWEYVLELIESFFKDDDINKDNYLKLFSLYFSLISDGNICMSLSEGILKDKWERKLKDTKALLLSKNLNKDEVTKDINNINDELKDIIKADLLEKVKHLTLLVEKGNKIFVEDNNYLYLKKYYDAKNSITESIKRLFPKVDEGKKLESKEIPSKYEGNGKVFELSAGQHLAASLGIKNNLIITGGPGTGKTTSILFILLNILKENINYDIKLVAPSGKAASRMKESIINTSKIALSPKDKENYSEELKKIETYEGSTIHKLLEMDSTTSIFKRNKNNRFSKDTIFVIDEASMIDAELFSYLLEAIEVGSKVFIMGDKNQLPSVDVGSVFASLLSSPYLKDYIVQIDESKRFPVGSDIYNLASKVNNGEKLTFNESIFKSYKEFKVETSKLDIGETPIYYYLDKENDVYDKDIIRHIVDVWHKEFYIDLFSKSNELDFNDIETLNDLFDLSEVSRILCSQNEGYRGTHYINELIRKNLLSEINKNINDINKKYKYNYPGELMIIKKNNKLINLFNGDTGIIVKFKDDKTLYFMVKKSSDLVKEEGKKIDKIFKIGNLYFYPLRLIAKDEIDDAYAITIHKSQGSDYKNILVILPINKSNPLLNRQILYTGITRTKGRTYILSNLENLNAAIDNVLTRDTNINIEK